VLAVAAAVAVLAPPAVYWLAVSVHPPVTSDGHRVMPIGQVAVALIAGVVLTLIAAILAARHGRG